MKQSTLTPEGYIPRLIDTRLSEALSTFGAVEVAGPMWSGKTWTSLAHGRSVSRLGRDAVRRVVDADPTTALMGDKPHVIDEWQDVPAVWDAVRDAVDIAAGEEGMFILTGSSSLKKDAVSHSGAGRIAKLRMNTMSLRETGDSTGAVSLRGLFNGSFQAQTVHQGLAPLARVICRGGWPALQKSDHKKAGAYLDSYFDAVFDASFPKRGIDSDFARSVALSLARNAGTAAKIETIGTDALGEGFVESDANRISKCIAEFESLYLIDSIRGWDAPIRSKSRLRTKPKRYYADPSMAASLLQITPERLMEDGQLFGMLFESLCMHDLAVYASMMPEATKDALRYYRDSDGLEVDAIIELRDGRWGAFEIKLGDNQVEKGIKALRRLERKIALNPAARNPKPSFMAVLVGAGEYAYQDKKSGVYIIPLTALGA